MVPPLALGKWEIDNVPHGLTKPVVGRKDVWQRLLAVGAVFESPASDRRAHRAASVGARPRPRTCVRAASLVDAPTVDVFLASIEDDVVGTVTVIQKGDTAGIWSMATDSTRQRSGVGRRLLSTSLAEARTQGARRFSLSRRRPAIGSTRAWASRPASPRQLRPWPGRFSSTGDSSAHSVGVVECA